ncbi:cryptochrome/photolyase family protein [Streptomyces sp. NPDC001193]
MTVSLVLFTSDLRVHDHPPLRAALEGGGQVVPLFVRDPAVDRAGFSAPNRLAFLADCLADLNQSLQSRGGRLIVRTGELVEQVVTAVRQADADEVHMAAGYSAFARGREARLRQALHAEGRRLYAHEPVSTVLPPGCIAPQGSDHFAVFTPYFRRWQSEPLRSPLAAPQEVRVPTSLRSDGIPGRSGLSGVSPGLAAGGEREGRKALRSFLAQRVETYEERHDDLAGDATSRLSAHLHFGTLSAGEAVLQASRHRSAGAAAFLRQMCWRDFHHQVLAARPETATRDYRSRGDRWRRGREAEEDLLAWQSGRTGYPVVDAAMRQLAHEGWMHNRGRLIAASFLTKTLYIDWREGARHFLSLLVDGDVANNQLNWQWVAGTGTDTRPDRVLNPVLQGRRYDPDGAYVRRWVPELAGLDGVAVHEPWRLPGLDRAALEYPDPLIAHSDGLARFRQARRLA